MFDGRGELEVHDGGNDLVEADDGDHREQIAGTEDEPRPLERRASLLLPRVPAGGRRRIAWRLFRRRVPVHSPPGGEGDAGDEKGDAEADPEPGGGVEPVDPDPHEAAPEDAPRHAAESDQTVEAFRRAGGDAVVQEGEEGRHHEGAEEIAEEIEGPHRSVARIVHQPPIDDEGGHEESAEDESELLPPEAPRQPGEDRHRREGDRHVQHLGEQLRL